MTCPPLECLCCMCMCRRKRKNQLCMCRMRRKIQEIAGDAAAMERFEIRPPPGIIAIICNDSNHGVESWPAFLRNPEIFGPLMFCVAQHLCLLPLTSMTPGAWGGPGPRRWGHTSEGGGDTRNEEQSKGKRMERRGDGLLEGIKLAPSDYWGMSWSSITRGAPQATQGGIAPGRGGGGRGGDGRGGAGGKERGRGRGGAGVGREVTCRVSLEGETTQVLGPLLLGCRWKAFIRNPQGLPTDSPPAETVDRARQMRLNEVPRNRQE